jgi:hypothetical protein
MTAPGAASPTVTVTVTPGVTTATTAHPAMDSALEVAQWALWPIVILAVAILYRRSIGRLISRVLGSVRSISVAGISLELAANPTRGAFADSGLIDIRHSGTENDVNDSTLRGFYEQLRLQGPTEFVVVNLGQGTEWLSSRLYILVVILMRMRGLRAVVFVDQDEQRLGHFVGVCPCEAIRWRLAQAYPRYEAALAAGELRVWYGTNPPTGPIVTTATIANDEGAFMQAENAAELLRGFLAAIQSPVLPATANQREPWQELTRTPPPPPGQPPSVFELATWLSVADVERMFDGVLDLVSIPFSDFQLADADARRRLIVEHEGPWIGLVRDQGRFHALVNRSRALENFVADGR